MVRTLTYVALLALLAGLAVGFFVSEAGAVADPLSGAAPAPDLVIEKKVALYVARYGLDANATAEVRAALIEYDRSILDLMRKLRVSHEKEFKERLQAAEARINAALPVAGR